MSFVLMQHVFYKSRHHGNAKVLLLALADYANECCGLAWPAVDTLAAKVGINVRNTHYLLRQVSRGDHPELEILLRQGPHCTNLYRLRGMPLGAGCPEGQGAAGHTKGCPWGQRKGAPGGTQPIKKLLDLSATADVRTHEDGTRPQDCDPTYEADLKAIVARLKF
jgi:hypothetical protein